ncbi:family 43 glycosylhydrolase [Microbacterium chocolatum]|uniref:family 43 glycosylhydrolase n=1 Tax=Microbacterium aurantiacum TaxID=162393 RepID=UPI00338F30C5
MPASARAHLVVVAAAVTALVAGLGGTASATAAIPSTGLVASYDFRQSAGSSVPNVAGGSGVGAATVRNLQPSDWTGSALTLRGGAKTSTGNWVELPDDLLAAATSATVVAEVRASQAMLDGFHFLWNIGGESAATEYFFSSLNCGSGRSPLIGLKTAGVERLVSRGSCGVGADEWVNVASVVDGDTGRAALYLDGVRVAEGAMIGTPADVADQSLNTIGRAPWPDPLFQGAISSFHVYDRALPASEIMELSLTDAEPHVEHLRARAQQLLDGLELSDLTTSTDIDLPTSAGRVAWESSAPDVVAPDGTVDAPLAGSAPVEVTLTAIAAVRGQEATETIRVTVRPSSETAQERIDRLAGLFVIPAQVVSGDPLPAATPGTTAEIVADTDAVVEGEVFSVEETTDATVEVRVTDAATAASSVRTFSVRVLPADEVTRILAYHRTPTSSDVANNADVALSMHLALADGDGWTPLNENYGIFFPKTSAEIPVAGPRENLIRSLRDPHVFHLADGGFGVIATRTARGGADDGTRASSVLFARSADLRSYDEVGMIDLGVTGGVNRPAAIFDSASDRYLVAWTSDAGAPMYTSFADLADPQSRGEVRRGAVSAITTVDDADVEDYAGGNAVAVDLALARALEVRFGRVSNTTVQALDAVELDAGESFGPSALPARAELAYTDGSTASRSIAWDAASVAAVDADTPGTYTVRGELEVPQYATPFADERADPSIFRYQLNGEQKFLMIATEDLYGANIDPQGGAHMPIRIADRIEDLSDEALRAGRNVEVDLLRRGDTDAQGRVMTGCFWAPEYHVIGGRLSILFMPCYDGSNGRPDMFTGRASIMQLQQDAEGNDLDPAVPGNWSKPREVLTAEGAILNPIQGISLDMTYFEDSGTSYYSWQMLGSLFIAEMDPADPTRLTSAPVRLTPPEYAWDNLIAEGPNVHAHDGTLYMIYSGSLVGDSYTTGLLTAPAGAGADLTDPALWSKLGYPIQKSGLFNGGWQLGTGHGMWSRDENDNLLYVFHARTDTNGLSGRDTFVRRVHFAADGLPIFDMEADEEVAPGNREVEVEVLVRPVAEPALDVTGVLSTRCLAGTVLQVVTVSNGEEVPAAVTIRGSYGSKTVAALAPGKKASFAFTTRQAAVPAAVVTLAASATVEGEPRTVSSVLSHPEVACGAR